MARERHGYVVKRSNPLGGTWAASLDGERWTWERAEACVWSRRALAAAVARTHGGAVEPAHDPFRYDRFSSPVVMPR